MPDTFVDIYYTVPFDVGDQLMVIGHFESTEEAQAWIDSRSDGRQYGLCNWEDKDTWLPTEVGAANE